MSSIILLDKSDHGLGTVARFQKDSICNSEDVSKATEQLRDYIEQQEPKFLIFDFANVKFFSSEVLGVLIDIRARMQDSGGELLVSGINPELYRVFRITNLNTLFRFFESLDQALQYCSM